MISGTNCAAWKKLAVLARRAFDLRQGLTSERIRKYVATGGGFDLLYATQRVDDQTLVALQELADEARLVDRFIAMKRGQVVNRIAGFDSENRMALHTACRDLFRDTPDHPQATADAHAELDKLREFLRGLESGAVTNDRGEAFTDMVQVGIGGSDLGPRAVALALAAFARRDRTLHFIANVDPDDTAAVLRGLDLSRTLVVIVSKSGSTLETLTNEALVRQAFADAGLDPAGHFLAVTAKGSPMDSPEKYLRSFYMFDTIGGRYSVTSMVGAVCLGFSLGMEQQLAFLQGAHQMDMAAEARECGKNPALLLALLGIWNRNFLGHHTVAVLPYSQALHRFTAHLQQCDMESNGKSVTIAGQMVSCATGPIVWGEPGTNGQHAFYQLLHQGTTVVPCEFIGFRHSQSGKDLLVAGTLSQEKLLSNLLAQSIALATGSVSDNPNRFFPGNRPNSVLLADRLDPFTMGALLALYEAKIVFQGFCWDINSFDQEGVQLGKRLADDFLGHVAAVKQGRASRLDGPSLAMFQAARLGQSAP